MDRNSTIILLGQSCSVILELTSLTDLEGPAIDQSSLFGQRAERGNRDILWMLWSLETAQSLGVRAE